MPQNDAGPRIEPPVQEPSEPMHSPADTAVPEPLLDPPGMCSRFQGFRASGKPFVGSGPPSANSCMASLPSSTLPACRSLAVVVASSSGTLSAITRELAVVRTPAVSYRSFRAMGTPCSGPRWSPRSISASAVLASASASSARTVM